MTYAGAFGIVMAMAVGATVLVLFIMWISNKTTGGRGVLYKFIQDYGYDDARTHDALEKVIVHILSNEGYGNGAELSFYHEVGNIYNGTFLLDDVQHDFTVRTDGWHVEYQIDNGRTKTWKP